MARDWSDIPLEALEMISENLHTNFVDLYRFRAVCKSWERVPLKKLQNPPPQLPWYLLTSLDNSRCRLYSLSDDRVYQLPPSQSFIHDSCCRRSSLGWLLMIDYNNLNTSLLNPLTGVRVSLPRITTVIHQVTPFFFGCVKSSHEMLTGKLVLSATPNSDAEEEVTAMIIYGSHSYRYLLYSHLGDSAWKRLKNTEDKEYGFDDVIYFKGKFYSVDSRGRVRICNIGSPSSVFTKIKLTTPNSFQGDEENHVRPSWTYLVESMGELLLIRRFGGVKLRRTVTFRVFKEDSSTESWVEVKTLQGHSLFLGFNQSLSLLASDYFRCKPNCIYFTDNIYDHMTSINPEPHDVGIFNLGNGIIEQLPGYSFDDQFLVRPPVFITPSPW